MSEFWQAYKDPRWQRKRLEIMKLYNFKCAHCGTSDDTLNVHHRMYRKGAKPWEYEDHLLQCLCEECHEKSHTLHRDTKTMLALLDDAEVAVVRGYCIGFLLTQHPDCKHRLGDELEISGLADFCKATEAEVESVSIDRVLSGNAATLLRKSKEQT